MTTSTPLLDSRVIGLAHYAARGVLESVLARHDLTFQQLITLRPVVTADGPAERADVVGQTTGALKTSATEADAVVDTLIGKGLVTAAGSSRVHATDAGRAVVEAVNAEIAPVTARIYADIPTADLATAARVLTVVTERANAELAAQK
ncbi:MarR family winged helix-turn-helix transcriptional regulator [Streptomyces sp. NPDC088387]|uniref:MarR family winged helix-turn-helix transcriptional regulator n=1 Tax=Streptomyces sp. NPDC088387 TaxID=3365859 RepID=UPI00382E5186